MLGPAGDVEDVVDAGVVGVVHGVGFVLGCPGCHLLRERERRGSLFAHRRGSRSGVEGQRACIPRARRARCIAHPPQRLLPPAREDQLGAHGPQVHREGFAQALRRARDPHHLPIVRRSRRVAQRRRGEVALAERRVAHVHDDHDRAQLGQHRGSERGGEHDERDERVGRHIERQRQRGALPHRASAEKCGCSLLALGLFHVCETLTTICAGAYTTARRSPRRRRSCATGHANEGTIVGD